MFDTYYITIIVIIIIELLLLRYVLKNQNKQGSYLNIFYLLYYIFQGVLSCIILILDKNFILANSNSSTEIPIKMSILPYCIGTLLAILGIVIAMSISNCIYKNANYISWSERIRI